MSRNALGIAIAAFLSALPLWSAVLSGPVTNAVTGNYYYLLSQNTWPASEAEAVQLGGHLVTIQNQAENDWVFTTFSSFGGQPRCLWIGFRRQELHGAFSWSSGSSSTFTNWSLNEPNDHFYNGEPEFFSFMWDPSRTEPFRMPGQWNDVPDITFMDLIPLHGVVEVVPLRATINMAVGGNRISWMSRTNRSYQLEYRASLAVTNSWLPLGSPISGSGSTNFYLDPTPATSERYYRIEQLP